jgi:thymidine kinase
MLGNKRLRHGVGANISVFKQPLHQRAVISKRYPNATKYNELDNLLAIGQEEKLVSKCRQVWLTIQRRQL